MSCSPARTGRHRQRYMDQFRLVAGCIPFKFEKVVQDNICDLEKKLLVLMISSPNRDDLVFPKGGWEDDETITEAACREALEEGGVKGILRKQSFRINLVKMQYLLKETGILIRGTITGQVLITQEEPLGDWEFRSKSRQNSCSVGGGCRGYMFALEVTEELDSWPEQDIYDRKWLTIDDAFKFCRYDWMREALKRLLRVLSEDRTEEIREEIMEFSILSVSDARADQTLSPVCFGKPSGVQHLDESCSKCAVLG